MRIDRLPRRRLAKTSLADDLSVSSLLERLVWLPAYQLEAARSSRLDSKYQFAFPDALSDAKVIVVGGCRPGAEIRPGAAAVIENGSFIRDPP